LKNPKDAEEEKIYLNSLVIYDVYPATQSSGFSIKKSKDPEFRLISFGGLHSNFPTLEQINIIFKYISSENLMIKFCLSENGNVSFLNIK